MYRSVGCVWLGAALVAGPAAQAQDTQVATPPSPAPLFSAHEVIELTLRAPLDDVFGERSQESDEFPAVVTYQGPDGEEVSVDLKVSTRGKFRLQRRICRFPPLSFNFPKSAVEGTLFAGQDKVKLVTHCRDRDDYEQYVLQEYLTYRSYNLLTDLSFQVRLARITYIDTEDEDDPLTKYAFFIEHKDALASRNGWQLIEDLPLVPPAAFDPLPLTVLGLFQFMIGNTDWSAFQAPKGEQECCHNTKVVGTMAGPVFSVPYDFDMSGIVDTRYSQVSEDLPIRNVRQRLYRGACVPRDVLMPAIQVFIEHQEAIYELYRNQPDLDPDVRDDTLEYLHEFYEIITDEDEIEDRLEDDCRRLPGMN